MMTALRCASFCALLPLVCMAATPDYFPLRVGNQWTYRASGYGEAFTLSVSGTRTLGGTTYYVVDGFPSGTAWLRLADDGTLYAWDKDEAVESVWVAFGASDGAAFTTSIDPCNRIGSIRSQAAKVSVPAGQFDNALQVDYAPASCADAGIVSEVYLPYVGLLQRTTTSFAGAVVYDLIYARLNDGLTTITAGEQSFTGALDASVYAAGKTAAARLTIRNTQAPPLSLTFPNGQRYDVVVRDADGNVVYQWSRGKLFSMLYGTMELSGEQTWVVAFPVPDAAGRYTVELSLATQPLAYKTTLGFTVK
jgi:hypothetical protein